MPVQITNTTYQDNYTIAQNPFYKSNAGDLTFMEMEFRSVIRLTSIGNPLTIDPILTIITSPSVDWVEEGFRVNDWCLINLRDEFGAVLNTTFAQISYVDSLTADFSNIGFWYDIANNEILEIIAVDAFNSPTPPPVGFNTPRRRDDLDILINHSLNTGTGNQFSLIDGEVTRFTFSGVEGMAVGSTLIGTPVGNQSGQFIINLELDRESDNADGWNVHKLRATFCNSGVYDETWFSFASCLKIYVKGLWASISGEPFDRTEFVQDDDANTGWFNEANNTSTADSSLIQGIDDLDYCVPSEHTIIVDGVDSRIAIGSCYVSTDDNYYRNKTESQLGITMIIPTQDVNTIPVKNSYTNSSGAGYTIEILSVNVVGSQTTIDIRFTPNALFNTFMENVDDGDRLFYVWVKCRNINLLAFGDQLSCEPPVGGPLVMYNDFGFLDHSQNILERPDNQTGFSADTEDDVAYFGSFRLKLNGNYESFQARIEAYNVVTGQDFTLQETNFDFSAVQTSGSGQLLLNETQSIVTTLPTTSVKDNALLTLYPTADDLINDEYGVSIYYPFLLNWKYWLPQNNANVDFYPTQNRNWEQYDNLIDWQLRIKLTLVEDGLAYTHTNRIVDNQYNNDPNIDSTIEMIRVSNGSVVSVIPEGELMKIRSTHVKLTGAWNIQRTWGMITIELKKAEQRWICSSIVPFDNNASNPLEPLATSLIQISYPTQDKAILECSFDTNKIDLSNGVKITAKIKEGCEDLADTNKITTDDVDKETTSDIVKIKA